MSSKLYLAYCEENKTVAKEIASKLGRAKFKFIECSSKDVKAGEGLTFSIARTETPGLLLLSDNFLKNEACMLNMLSFIQKSSKSENMQIIVIDGQYKAGNVPTSFDRVSNVIKYMNHWQEVYLEMRKKKRNIDPSLEESFNTQLQNIKNISSEIGDFLRVVRGKVYWSYDQMKANNYELFFKKYANNSAHASYVKIASGDPKPIEPSKTITPPIKTPPPVVKSSTSEVVAPKTINDLNANKTAPILNQKVSDGSKKEISTPPPVLLNDKFAKSETPDKSNKEEIKEIEAIDRIKQMNQPTVNETLSYTKPTSIDKILQDEEEQINEVLDEVDQINADQTSKKDNTITSRDPNETFELESVFEDEPDDKQDESSDSSESQTSEMDDVFIDETSEKEDSSYEEEEIEEIDIEDITADFNPVDEMDEVEDITDLIGETKEEPIIDIPTQIIAAKSLITDGAHKAGCQHFDQLIEENPGNQELKLEYAQLLKNEIGASDKAVIQLEQLVKQNPGHEEAFHLMAEIAEENNDFLLAKEHYEKIANLNPDTEGIYYKLGLITASFMPDNVKLAAKYFKKAIEQNPKNIDAHFRYGIILKNKLDKPKKAIKQFKEALEIDPVHAAANYETAILLLKQGDKDKAAKYYKNACIINPDLKTDENDALFAYKLNEDNSKSQTIVQQDLSPVPNTDQVVLITGATSGIGLATARKFAENGFRIIMTGRRDERLIELKEEFDKNYKTNVKILPFDVRNLDEVKSMINQLEEEWRDIDILINNAGLAKGYDPIHEADIEHWDTMIDTNIKGLLYMTRAISPNMVKRKSGHIINVCSSAGKSVYPNGSVYCATKHAVDALTKSMRLDLYKHNIRVGQVSPAHVEETEFAYVRFEDKERAKIYEDFQPLKASDVAESIYFIATAPPHVNIQDIYLMGKQQAENTYIDRSGR